MGNSNNQQNITKGTIIVLTACIFWGFSGVCGQFLTQNKGITIPWLVPNRLVFAGLVMVIMGFINQGRQFLSIWKNDAKRLLVFAMFGMSFCQFSYFSSIAASNAGTATVLQQISIIFIMLYTCIKSHKLPNTRESLALFLAMAGAFLIATHGMPNTLVMSATGLFWGLCNALAVSLYTLIPVRLINKYGALSATGWAMLIGGILLQIAFQPWKMSVTIDNQIIYGLIVIIIFGTILPFSMYLRGVVLTGPTRASMMTNVEPLTAAVISATWLGSSFHVMDIIGSICILSTIFILSSEKNIEKKDKL